MIMPRGRSPEGQHALSNAERQARFRARCLARQPVIRTRCLLDRLSGPQRWQDVVAELLTLQIEYAAWLAALPDNLQDIAIAALDLGYLAEINPRRGHGRD